MVTDAKRELENALRRGEMKVTGRLVDASNATMLATVTYRDLSLTCIYKPVAGERPLWDFSDGTLANREYAAYVLSERCNFDVVPLTVLREGPFGEGAVQLWVDIDESIDMTEYFQRDNVELRNMALFDAVINNTDRKIGHILPDVAGKVYGCDHGVTFHYEDKLRTVLWRWAGGAISKEESSRLKNVSDYLKDPVELKDLLTEEEIQALRHRVNRLQETGSFPMPSKDWPAVPWPPY
jgi:uncharacterized repeat protein (TIGR03843 family)